MKRMLVLLIAGMSVAFTACGAGRGNLTPESREALERLRTEKIMCPIQLFTNCTLVADFSVTSMRDSCEKTFTGQMSTSNRSFNFSHGYINMMFSESVEITTASDTTGYAGQLSRWVKNPLDFDSFLSVFSPRKNAYKGIGAQLEYLGTENGMAKYEVYYVAFDKVPVTCTYWCNLQTCCITRATVGAVLEDGSRLWGEVVLNPYSGIGRTNYPQDACYLKFAKQIDYRLTRPNGDTLTVRLQNIRLEDIGVYKTGRAEKE